MLSPFTLNRKLLRLSTNSEVQKEAQKNFIAGGNKGIEELRDEANRNLKFKNVALDETLKQFLGSNLEKKEERKLLMIEFLSIQFRPEILDEIRMRTQSLTTKIDKEFKAAPNDKLKPFTEFSQGHIVQIGSFILKACEGSEEKIQAKDWDANMDLRENHLILEERHNKFNIQDNLGRRIPYSSETTSLLSEIKEGDEIDISGTTYVVPNNDPLIGQYQLQHINSDSDLLIYLMMGGEYAKLDWFGKNIVLGREALIPWTDRLVQGFRYQFTGRASNENDWSAFLGIPGSTDDNKTTLDKVGYALGGFVLIPLKNTLKLFSEYLTFALKETCRSFFDGCRKGFEASDKINNPILKFTAKLITGVGMAITGIGYYACDMTHEAVKRVTSPERSAQEAAKKHPALKWVSRAFSLAAYIGLAIILPPIGIPLVGKYFGAQAATATASSLSQVAIPTAAAPIGTDIALGVGLGATSYGAVSISSAVKTKMIHSAQETEHKANEAKICTSFNRARPAVQATPSTHAQVSPFFKAEHGEEAKKAKEEAAPSGLTPVTKINGEEVRTFNTHFNRRPTKETLLPEPPAAAPAPAASEPAAAAAAPRRKSNSGSQD